MKTLAFNDVAVLTGLITALKHGVAAQEHAAVDAKLLAAEEAALEAEALAIAEDELAREEREEEASQ